MGFVKLNGGGLISVDKETLFELLLKKTQELGRELSFEEARNDPDLPNPNEYAYYFGSFSEVAKKAFLRVGFEKERSKDFSRKEPEEPQIGAYSSVAAQRNGFEKVSHKKRVVKEKKERAIWTDERVLEAVETLYDQLGRMPSRQEYDGFRKETPEIMPSSVTIAHRFYRWTNVAKKIETRKLERVRKEMSEMAKKKSAPERDDESARMGYVELVLDEWREKGQMPSPRSLKKNSLFKYDKLLAVFGSYQELERVVTEKAREQGLISEKAVEIGTSVEARAVEPKSEVKKMKKEEKKQLRKWSKESVIEALKRFYDEQGRLPVCSEIATISEYDFLPALQTIYQYIGKKENWLEAIGVEEVEEAEEVIEAEEVAEAEDVMEAFGMTRKEFDEEYNRTNGFTGRGMSQDEMNTMLEALDNVKADDDWDGKSEAVDSKAEEPEDDPFDASGELTKTASTSAALAPTTPARAAIVLNEAIHKMLDEAASELSIASASVEVIVEVDGVPNPVVMRLEF